MLNKPFKLLGKEIPAGSKTVLDLEIAKLHTRTTVKVPVIIERSIVDGPVILLMAGLHGDEVNGVGIIREIIQQKLNKPKAGTIICLPVFNIFGYLFHSREFPDGRDLNRVFPGNANGSLASQFAHQFTTEIAPYVDYVIDYHTGGGERDNVSQIRIHPNEVDTLKLAEIFNPPFIIKSNYISKSVRFTLNKMGKTILLFEGGKANELNKEIIAEGVKGTKNILVHLGFIDGEIQLKRETIFIENSKWQRASHSGMFQAVVKNGSFIKKKEIIGYIQDPFGEFKKKVTATHDAYIFCINRTPIVNKGDAIFHLGTQ
ncbi:MAG: succinylglutamate desuccinylase/aspartoacylase family protein [Flavobacteriaceae bacterium]|nr:succinylglutamate desuccinylase/aspartoacylase family protein [Flavobacteriaceae bacterium]